MEFFHGENLRTTSRVNACAGLVFSVRRRRRRRAIVIATVSLSLSCGSTDLGEHPDGRGGATETGARDAGTASPAVVDSSATLTTGPTLTIDGSIGAADASSLDDAACATESQRAEQLPLDIYIMLDSSGSMATTLSDNVTTKWSAVTRALTSFVNDPGSRGLGVGLQYFPLIQPGVAASCDPTTQAADCGQFGPCDVINACSNSTTTLQRCSTASDCGAGGQCVRLGGCLVSPQACLPIGSFCSAANGLDFCLPLPGNCHGRDICDADRYAAPAVEISTLPAAAANIVSSLNQHMPDGLTPTSGALAGALTHAKALATANPSHRVVVVLATDGLPTECDPTDIASIGGLASAAAASMPAISTFVIGVFSPSEQAAAQANLGALARAGGTDQAFLLDTSQDVTMGFLGALNAIRTTALTCAYEIPTPQSGRLDFGKVNVRFASGSGQSSTIGYVPDPTSCTSAGGWYYDVIPPAGTPTKILVCDSTCKLFKSDAQGQVDILLGCQTQAIVR